MRSLIGKTIKCFLIVLFLIGMIPAGTIHADASGKCGDSLTWSFNESSKTITISGTGPMYDYRYKTNDAPWASFSNKIEKAIIGDGVTSIGTCAFLVCTNLKEISIPGSVKTIGEGAFQHCYALTEVRIPKGVETIGEGAFMSCDSLQSVYIPNTVRSIGEAAFFTNEKMTTVTFEKLESADQQLSIIP